MFNIQQRNRIETGLFSESTNKILYQQEKFPELFSFPFSKENILKQINVKQKNYSNRNILYNVIKENYSIINSSKKVKYNIELLKQENTFTFCTGHQLCLFTGPFYFIIKILHTIKLCEDAKNEYPDYNFVPIYWMASEDHDFEEISSLNIFREKISWERNVNNIPVGELDNNGLQEVIQKIESLFKNINSDYFQKLNDFFAKGNYAKSFFEFVNYLFEDYGLIILDANNKELKSSASSIFQKEIHESFSKKSIEKQNELLKNQHFETKLNPRNINLFYIDDNKRYRIDKISETEYQLFEGKEFYKKITLKYLLEELKNNPQKFSPNVALRPIFQECILPNLGYIGGSNEILYWLQLKNIFETINIPFPLLIIRNSVMIIDENTSKKINKLNLKLDDIFKTKDQLIKEFLISKKDSNIDFNDIELKLNNLKSSISLTIDNYDINLTSFKESEIIKIEKIIDNIKQQILKREKQKYENELQQINDIKNRLFPDNMLQERYYNFLHFCPNGDINLFIEFLYKKVIKSFEKDLIIAT